MSKSKLKPSREIEEKFVVCIDFGTTFTSVAFAHSSSPDEVKLVQTWHNGSSSSDHVPTELRYVMRDPDSTSKVEWGYGISRSSSPEPLKWFKLLLQRSERSTLTNETPAQRTAKALGKLGIAPVKVVSDFLKAVRETTATAMETTYGAKWIEGCKTVFVLTIPAIWDDSARDLMVQAAQNAGYGVHLIDFHLVTEPEAAAAYSLHSRPHNLNRGDSFVICDAGGGTVDLISYRIVDTDPLRIVECARGTGDLCGSIYLDQRFEEYMRSRIGHDIINKLKPKLRTEMMRTWEEKVKLFFGGSSGEDMEYEVSIHGIRDDEEKDVEDGIHKMSYGTVQKIFDPIIDRITELVEEQVSRSLKSIRGKGVSAILLVGGFGSSQYLFEKLRTQTFSIGRKKMPIEVIQPVNARSAIARGALLRGLDGTIVRERRARRYYGCVSEDVYRNRSGLESHRYYCNVDDCYMVPNKLNWYIRKNQIIRNNTSKSLPFIRDVLFERGVQPDLHFKDELLVCDQDEAPDYKWRNPDAVRRICTLNSDLSMIPTSCFEKKTNAAGDTYLVVVYYLKMFIEGEVLKFQCLVSGTVRGNISTDFD